MMNGLDISQGNFFFLELACFVRLLLIGFLECFKKLATPLMVSLRATPVVFQKDF
jgi:hypothetical protein